MLIGKDIGIIGAGVAGLACARALAARGARVTVYERAPALVGVGAGIQISPNGAAVLSALGLEGFGLRSTGVSLRDGARGRPLIDLNFNAELGAFHLCHRADLMTLLASGLDALGITLKTGAEITDVSQTPDGATLTYGETTCQHDLILGADGVKSLARKALNGDDHPAFTGYVAWRALVEVDRPQQARAQVYMNVGQHIVTYPLRDGQLVNIVAVERGSDWRQEGWHHAADPDDFRACFAGFSPDVTALLSKVENVSRWALMRHDVAQHWGQGQIALLGDAAHPTLPFMAQGANLALEDAWVLASLLASHDTDEALTLYREARAPRVTRALDAAAANGESYHMGGIKRAVAHTGLRAMGRVLAPRLLQRYDWLYGYDVTKEFA